MNLSEIREEVKLLCQDSSVSDDSIDGYINQVLLDVCAQCMIPGLKSISTVTTSTTLAYVSVASLTGGFTGRLIKVLDGNGDSVEIVPSLELLMEEYGTMTAEGDIERCCVEGSVLWYAKIPAAAETLTLLYFRDPEELVADEDVPEDLPTFCHRALLVNGTAEILFSMIEQGVDGNSFNTLSNRSMKQDGMRKLYEWLGRNRKHTLSSIWSV